MTYEEFVNIFNNRDYDTFVNVALVEDFFMSFSDLDIRGRQDYLNFLKSTLEGIRSVMRPQRTIELGDDVFAEIDMDFHATAARPDFPFGAMGPGDLITVKFLASHRMRDGRFAEIKIANWPPELGVTKLPRLGPEATQIAAFHAYAAAFSAGDTERFGRFYTDDIVLELGAPMPPLHGKEAIAGFYRKMYETVREKLTIHNLLVNEKAIVIEHTARFTAVMDAPQFDVMPLRKGEVAELPGLVYYTLRDGLISHVRVFPRGAPVKLG